MIATREFDYVIVGAGSAGCVLAGRLTADPTIRVLLLEAGGWDWHPLIRIPLGVGRNLQDHYSSGLFHERREPGPFVAATRFDRLALNFAQAYLAGSGPATDVPSGCMAFVKTDPSMAMPDIQFLFRSGPSNAGPWFPGIKSAWHDA